MEESIVDVLQTDHALWPCTQVNITVYDTVPKSLRNNPVVNFLNASLSTTGTSILYDTVQGYDELITQPAIYIISPYCFFL